MFVQYFTPKNLIFQEKSSLKVIKHDCRLEYFSCSVGRDKHDRIEFDFDAPGPGAATTCYVRRRRALLFDLPGTLSKLVV